MQMTFHRLKFAMGAGLLLLVGIDAPAQKLMASPTKSSPAPFSMSASGDVLPPWHVMGLPNTHKLLSRFDIVELDNRHVLRVQTDHSYANLVHELALPAAVTKLSWRWRLDQPLMDADLRQRSGDDAPLKICIAFEMSAENLGFIDRQLLSMARSSTTEHIPAATLCYVWDHLLPAGTLLNNAFTSRVRQIVVDSGEEKLGQWTSHQRDIAADFRRAFGQESTLLPPIEAVIVGADSDNTGGKSLGYVGDITLTGE